MEWAKDIKLFVIRNVGSAHGGTAMVVDGTNSIIIQKSGVFCVCFFLLIVPT